MTNFTRRTVLSRALASTAVAMSGSIYAQHSSSPVYLDYDQEALDRAYDQAPWAPNQAEIAKRRDQKRELARGRLNSPDRFSYGPTEIEGLDVYATDSARAPVHIHIHGGTWRFGDAAGQVDLAEINVAAGAHFVPVDFTNVTETGGDLVPLVQQVRRAVAWVYENAERFGGDSDRLYLSGHSSGGHLGGVLVTTDWESDYGLPGNLIKSAVLTSGMYDLYPVSLSFRNTYVNFTEQVIQDLSPQRHIDNLACPVTIAFGTQETPEFQRQSRDFASAIAAAGKSVRLVVAEGYNHFEVSEDYANPYGVIGRSLLAQMHLI